MPSYSIAVICDLDGTLCDDSHRSHFVDCVKKDFKSYYAGMLDDGLNREVADLIAEHSKNGVRIIFLTGRPRDYTNQTIKWLRENVPEIVGGDNWDLIMRIGYDHAVQYKKNMYEKYIKDKYNVILALDDMTKIISLWKDLGIPAKLIGEGLDY